MTFIVTFISLMIERFFHWRQLRQWRWFSRYQLWLAARVGHRSSYLLLLASILPPVLIIGLMNLLLSHWILGVLKLIFNVIVLTYCLGPNNFWVQVYSSIDILNKEDPNIAIDHVNASFKIGQMEDKQHFHRSFTNAIFLTAYESVFAVLFWFVVLGPMGAVLYRLMTLTTKETSSGLSSLATEIQSVLDWLPIRIFTFFFALSGHFTEVFSCWKHYLLKSMDSNHAMLTQCGIAALDVVEETKISEGGIAEKAALSLLDRVFVMSMVILAVLVLLL